MEINDVVVSHDGTKRHLNGVTTAIQKGEITTIIGPKMVAGNSTSLSVMARNNRPLKGNVQLEHRDLVEYKPKEFARKFAIVYQQNDIPSDLTVEKLVMYGACRTLLCLRKNCKKMKTR